MEQKFVELAKKTCEIQAKIKFLKAQADTYKALLKEICSGETTSFKGYTYAKIKTKGAIKYSIIPLLKDLDLEPYRGNPIVSWRLKYEEQFEEII